MSIRFAAARRPCAHRLAPPRARMLACTAFRSAANDNAPQREIRADVLHAALRHFAQHGVSAARVAGEAAQAALLAGDVAGHARWIDICRTLDRRMAARLARSGAAR